MEIADLPLHDPRESISNERLDLLVLLDGLSDNDWFAATESGHWRVKDVALHLLDDDLGWLSRGRDGDRAGSCRQTATIATSSVHSTRRTNSGSGAPKV